MKDSGDRGPPAGSSVYSAYSACSSGLDGVDETFLAGQIAAGERELFRLFIERYQQKVHALGLSFFHNREDAADFTQDVFIRAYRSLGSFRGHARFSTWLYRIAYNTAVNNINRRKEYHSLAEEPITEENPAFRKTP